MQLWTNKFEQGTLPGYWLGAQDGRPSSPFISRESWHARLLDAGFPGIGVALSDYPEPDDCTSVMIASKALSNEPTIDVNGNNRASSVVVNGDNLKSSEGSGIVWLVSSSFTASNNSCPRLTFLRYIVTGRMPLLPRSHSCTGRRAFKRELLRSQTLQGRSAQALVVLCLLSWKVHFSRE